MNRFQNILAKMKRWLRRGHTQQVVVRTFVGDFVGRSKGIKQPASYDEYLKYAELSRNLRLLASDVLRVADGKRLKHEIANNSDGIEQFNQSIAVYCSDFAKDVAAFRNQMK
ncbi:MAG: hypothetical protein Q9M16_03315 [Mariprofundus sp.]|nr:hypothetical protein [Mariprofundus sp.]